MWLKVDGFVEQVREWWQSYVYSGSPSFVLHMKLKALKRDLKMWNRDVFGDLNFRKAAHLQELSSLDELDERGIMDGEGKERKLSVSRELDHLIELEEMSWRQKSRALWLKEGDRCTKFFHKVANSNRRNNSISSLELEGAVVEDPSVISEAIVDYYSSLYKEPFS
jgi:hypothetical protein